MFLFLFQLPARRSPSETKVQLEPALPVHLFKVGWDLLIVYRPGPSLPKHRCTRQHSTAEQSRAAGRAAAAAASSSGPIKTSPQTCPASTHSHTLTRRSRRRLVFIRTAFYCILHCVALCRSCSPVSLSVRVFSLLIDILWVPIITPYHTRPAFLPLSHFPPVRVTTIHNTPRRNLPVANTTSTLFFSPLYLSLSLLFPFALSAVNSEPPHRTHPAKFNLAGHLSSLGQNSRISESCLLMWLHIPELTTFESN